MAKESSPIDVTDAPDVLRLVEEVQRSGLPRVLRRGGEDVAILSPVPPPPRRRTRKQRTYTPEDDAAFLAAAGAWQDDGEVEQFLRDNAESRSRSTRPSVDL